MEVKRHFLISCTALNYERHNLYILVSQSITDFNLLSDESKFLTLMSNPLICKSLTGPAMKCSKLVSRFYIIHAIGDEVLHMS